MRCNKVIFFQQIDANFVMGYVHLSDNKANETHLVIKQAPQAGQYVLNMCSL